MDTVEQLLASGIQSHQAGRLAEAELAYREALRLAPSQPDALHLLGLLAYQAGQHRHALALMEEALRVHGEHGGWLVNLSSVQQALGNLREAERLLLRAVALDPADPTARVNLGNLLVDQGRWAEAQSSLQAAVTLAPGLADAHSGLGRAQAGIGNIDGAIASHQRALAQDPTHFQSLCALGEIHYGRWEFPTAAAYYRLALQHGPGDPDLSLKLGFCLLNSGERAEAIPHLEQAAASLGERARQTPDDDSVWLNLGTVLRKLERLEEAARALERARALRPDSPAVQWGYARVMEALGEPGRALDAARSAVSLAPSDTSLRYTLAELQLLTGNFREGWANHESRAMKRGDAQAMETLRQLQSMPRWQGEPLDGRTIVLHGEQGFGDVLQFVRYAPWVAARGGRVVLEVRKGLEALVEGLPGVERVLVQGEALPDFDLQCPLMSLPMVFETDLETVPGDVPYLRAPAAAASWSARVAGLSGLKVGLVWAGNPTHRNDHVRSLPLDALEPLWRVSGVSWVSLQKGPREGEAAALPLLGLGRELPDFAATAAVVTALDLVVAVDTAVVHLAGALGVPVWVLLPVAPDWRWLLERNDSPWYPTMRLFRQTTRGVWRDVLQRVADELRVLAIR